MSAGSAGDDGGEGSGRLSRRNDDGSFPSRSLGRDLRMVLGLGVARLVVVAGGTSVRAELYCELARAALRRAWLTGQLSVPFRGNSTPTKTCQRMYMKPALKFGEKNVHESTDAGTASVQQPWR